jgi:hypothetical protein
MARTPDKRDGDMKLIFKLDRGEWCDFPGKEWRVRLFISVPECHFSDLKEIGFYTTADLEARNFEPISSGEYEWTDGKYRMFRSDWGCA